MAKVDPFIVQLPSKLGNDPELGPYFQYLQKFLHDMWKRSGAGTDLVDGAAVLTANQTFSGDNTFTENVNLTTAVYQVDGVQVVTAQQTAVADAAAATAANPAAPTAYSAHATGAVTVLSNAATDLDTTTAALATLRGEVATYETAISALIVDVADIRTQLNSALAKLRTHGLIVT